ncbi:MAG TPA: PAS domain S-box protein [Chthoniobacteraceae bacterium]|nr:PAS domain S-box protein [Chthoniobacteraceae bacterium]
MEKEPSFELLFEKHPHPMWVFDEESFAFLAVNEAALEKYGYSREEFLALTIDQLAVPEDLPALYRFRARREALADEAEENLAWRHVCKDGSEIEVETLWSDVPFDGRPAVLVVINDRTAYHEAEKRAREQADLLDLASDAIMVFDLEGQITFWNQGATRLYGWTVEEAIGAEMIELLMPDTAALAETERGVRERGEWSGQLTHLGKDGRQLIVNSRWTLVRDDAGQPKAVLVINTDLTETKKLEAQFLRAQRQESIGTLASGIAHDLNNILSPILMSVSVLRKSVSTKEGEKILAIIESSAERGAGIVKQVLTFARGVEGERVLLQPKHLLSEMGKILAQTFPRNIDIKTQYPQDLWVVSGDATQLHQVLLNLCVNARDAMGAPGGTLTICAENIDVDAHFARTNPGAQLGEHVVLRVTDTGEGMSPATMDKIFDPFFTTKEVGKGTGLGLATVIGIVKSHGGFLTVQSEIGVGTSFRIFLPACKQEGNEIKQTTEGAVENGQGELILVVDDEAPIREALVQTLEDYGYRAYTAEDGSDAIALYSHRRGEFKLVLTDLAMAQMDGIALVRALRKMDPGVKVIVSSGHLQPEQTVTLEKLGVKHFLDKPYTANKLLRTIRASLAEPTAA